MGCVNRSSKEFKNLAARNNVAINALELITHKYWLQTGNETLFPSDVYIQAQLGNTHYQEDGKNVRKLWNREYKSPIEFHNLQALDAAKEKAMRFFPQSAIISYKNAKGNFVLSVKRPVEKADYTKDSFFEEMDKIGSMKDIKVLDLGIKENYSYGIDKVKNLYDRFNTDRTSKDLADRAFTIASDLGLNITFGQSLPFGNVGRYTNNNTITYKKSFLERDIMNDIKAPIILHEIIHALSMYALSDQTANWKRPESLQKFRTEMNSLYQDLKNNPILKGERGVVDLFEFVAELGNPVFRAKLKEIDKQNKEKKSFWSRILDAFKSLIGLHTSNSYYQRSMNALDKALDAFDVDTYMRYNGIKNSLRQGYNAKEWEFNSMTDKEVKDKVGNYFDSQVYDEELLSLKKKAIADGTFMKAPNGKPTNLNERQWLQVRTQAFKDWFGDWENDSENASKVVDANGEPLVVYHGTQSSFKKFSKEKRGSYTSANSAKIAFFAASSKLNSAHYAKLEELMTATDYLNEAHKVDANLTLADIGASDDFSEMQELQAKYASSRLNVKGRYYSLADSYAKYLSSKGNTKTINQTLEIAEEYEWIDNADLSDYRKEGYIITPEQEKRYRNGETIKITKSFTRPFQAEDTYDMFSEENDFTKEHRKEISNYYKALEDTTKEYKRQLGEFVNSLNSPYLLSVFLNIKNPQVDDDHNLGYRERSYVSRITDAIKESKDGGIIKNTKDPFDTDVYYFFEPNQIKSATDNNGEFSTTNDEIYNYELSSDYVKTLTGKQLKDELGIIKQESADYNLVNGIEEEKKHSGKAVPQDFTFADGTKVKAPFRPNAQQVDALNAMDAFMKSNETSMTLSGYAGTGKTSLMEMIAKKGRLQGRAVMFCASTNKAAAVLNERVSKAGFRAETLNKVFGISVEVDSTKAYNARNLVNRLKDVDIIPGTTIIIDEASMINEENYGILNDIAERQGLKIIYVGDDAQLAPVNEDKISKVFRNGEGKVIRLTQVERTDDNAILKEATDIRNGKPLSGESSFNSKGEGVAYISPKHQGAIDEVIEHYVKGLKSNPNYFRILAYTNKAVTSYNNQVRELLGYTSPIPNVGEPMTGYANWGYDWRSKSYRFINSESYKVVQVGKPKKVEAKFGDIPALTMVAIPLTLENSMGERDTFDFMDIKSNPQNRQAATLLANEKKRLWNEVKRVYGATAKAQILQTINAIDKFLFVNDNIEDNNRNLLQAKTIDFGYAMTVHKSQGSTFTNVLMDDVDISRASFDNNNAAMAIDVVDLEDNGNNATSIDDAISLSDEIDLGDLSSVEVPEQQDSQVANTKRQLEYVGVSRATDTVTVISNNVKKEGSPLHPETTMSKEEQASKATESDKDINGLYSEDGKTPITIYRGYALKEDREANTLDETIGHTAIDYDDTLKGALYFTSSEEEARDYAESRTDKSLEPPTAEHPEGNRINRHYTGDYAKVSKFHILSTAKVEHYKDIRDYTKNGRNSTADVIVLDKGTMWADNTEYVVKNPNVVIFAKAFEKPTITQQVVDHLKSIPGINVLGRSAMEEFLKTHNIAGLQQAIAFGKENPYVNSKYKAKIPEILSIIKANKYNNSGTDIVTLNSDNHKTIYLVDHSADNELTDNLKDGDGFGIRKTYDINKLTENDIKEITRNIAGDYRNSEKSIRNRLQRLGITPENLPSIDIDAAIKRGIRDYGEMDARARGFGKQALKDRSSIDGRENQGMLPLYTTEQGEVYGFVDKEGNIYLDETKISPNHPIHEYTHLWDRTVQKKNPKLWQKGIELMKKTSLWNDILNDKNYGKQWQSMNLPKEKLESLIASEVHARLVGENGEKLLNNLAKQKGQEGIIGKLKQWILDMWKEVKATFGNWSQEDIDRLTLKDFNHMTVRDFAEGTNLHEASNATYTESKLLKNTSPITKIISGGQTGVDTIGLQVAKKLGIETGGKAPKGFLRERGIDSEDIASYGLTEISDAEQLDYTNRKGKRDPYTGRTELNVRNSDGTVYFATDDDSAGRIATERSAKEWNKPFLLNPTVQQLREWIITNNIRTLNIAGNRGSTLPTNNRVASIIEEALTTKEKGTEPTVTNPTFKEGEVQKVSLPGYEYFNELYDETPVDAAWKVPYLKELDAQLSTENSPEENDNIINNMDKVLQATSEKEYLQEVNDSKKKEVDKNLDEYEKLNKQIDTLLDSKEYEDAMVKPLSAIEIRHVGELAANEISDIITRLQTEEGLAEKMFPTLNTTLDFQKASRKQIVETVNINNLIQKAKDLFDAEIQRYTDIDTSIQADVIWENWDAIMYLAADVFAMNEGFGIAKDYSKGNFTTTESSKTDFDNFNDYSNDPDAAREEGEKDEQEHWQIESKTIDVLNSMSALVRQGIHECYQLDKDGNKILSKWGPAERVNPRQAVNSILRWTQGAMSLDDMIQRLSDKQKQNPWLSQLVQRLSDKSGKETDFQSQFYGVFQKHFQPYSIVLLEDGKYHSIMVNSHPALTEVMNTITSQFKIGEHPLFQNNRVNGKLLGNEDTVGKDADFNLHKALAELREITKTLRKGEALDSDMSKTATDNIMATCKVLGYPVTEEMLTDVINEENIKVMTEKLGFLVRDLSNAYQAQQRGTLKNYDPFAFGGDHNIGGTLRNFLTPITDKMEDTAVNAFYDSGKMYQSYITPSFMTKLFNKFRLEGQAFEDFILDEYGSSEWFKFNAGDGEIGRGWRNDWLKRLATDEGARKVFDHKVELNFNKHNYMRNMSDTEYTLSLITEYFSENTEMDDLAPAWYRVPMQSNKPSSEFIKFYSYRGSYYKKDIARGLYMMFLQELSRIQTVRMRNCSKNDPQFIKNFDTNGKKFCFLPVFNAYLENDAASMAKRDVLRNEDNTISSDNNRFATLLQNKLKGEEALTEDEDAEFGKLADRIIHQSMENRVQSILENWENNGILEAAQKIKGIYPSEFSEEAATNYIRKQVENFLWNDAFASKNILQLTLTDIAFYKDTEDLQKRLAQLHAPGIRGNIYATDYEGNRVSDGNYRTVILKDFDSFKSNIIANIAEVFDRKIANAPEHQKATLMALKESLVGEDGSYTKINVTDAQGYSSPSSYRKKAFIFGKWSKQAEDIYQKLRNGNYTYTDLETAFQPLKPFVYSKLTKDMGVDYAPIHSMQVPFQAKNAEYLLIMADAILQGEQLSRPNLLRAVYRVMEDSEKFCPTKGIDTVQFESAIKSGLQGKMDIFQYRDMAGGEEAAYTYMMNQIFKEETNATGERVYKNYNTDTFVQEASYEDYCLQQEVPEHFKEHSQAHGSQTRMIIPSDLDFYTTDENGNQVDNYYEWNEPTGEHRKVKADEFRKEYEDTIAESIEESIDNLSAELHLNSEDKKERNIALSKILQREILSSPRYGIDLVQACSIDKETGEFRIPKGDPIQAKRIEQLINSVIKNRINKQKIAGGPIVQVSNFGTSKQLHIRFNDRKGNLMPLEEEYNPSEHNNMSYEEYCKKEQGGIAYFEVFCPIWSNELFEKFANEDGTINVAAIEATDPELLKMVSYRIPTEDKYSCAPMKVVGFMPREAGDAIMFPYELTEIDDSDFDVDKRYVMRKDIPIKAKRRHEVEKELLDRANEIYKRGHNGKTNNQWVKDQVRMFLDNPQRMKTTDKFQAWLYKQYQQVAYKTAAPKAGKVYRDNKIVDMTYAVLTNQMTADKILNPGGFKAPKRMGYMVAAYKNAYKDGLEWSDLQGMTTEELKTLSYTDKDLTFADTQVQFYKQNSAAASLIGVFAVNKVAHATLESNDLFLDVSEICGDDPFTIAGTTFGGRMQVDQKYDREGNLIGKTLGSLVSASADAVKDPILNLMNVNMTTAGMLNTMLRLGMTFNDAALFLSQDIIERMLNQFNRENLTGYKSLGELIEEWLAKYSETAHISDTSNINTEELTEEELVEGLTSKKHEAIDYKVLLAFQKMQMLVDAMRKPTYATRFNSISSAVGPLIVDNLIMEHKMEQFIDANAEDGTHFYTADGVPVDIDDIFFDHPILKQFSRTVDIAKSMFMDMPTGSTGFRNLLSKLPKDISDKMYNDKKLLDSFSNFYQSYLLVQSSLIDANDLKAFVNVFPKRFIEEGVKEHYPDNELIQAIRLNVAKKTGRPYLQINLTGMDEQRKEELRSAWIDLHKKDPQMSKWLFEYSFFRAGIGFSPKTFMALVPTYVKERLKSKDGSASYVDTYRNFPEVVPEIVIDQFIRNNWNDNKLVPIKGGKDTHYNIDVEHGLLTVYREDEKAALGNATYIKTKNKKQTYLWKRKEVQNGQDIAFELVKPLGNNGEYLEMSTSDIKTPLTETLETAENNETSDLKSKSSQESSAEEASNSQGMTKTEQIKNIAALADLVMKQNPKLDKEASVKLIGEIKDNPKKFSKFLQNVFKHAGLDLSIEEAINEFKKYC